MTAELASGFCLKIVADAFVSLRERISGLSLGSTRPADAVAAKWPTPPPRTTPASPPQPTPRQCRGRGRACPATPCSPGAAGSYPAAVLAPEHPGRGTAEFYARRIRVAHRVFASNHPTPV